MGELLQTSAISVWRGDDLLLNDVSLKLGSGQVLQVLGTNGSGKTTLLRIICGLAYADEGEVYWRGVLTRDNREQFHQELLYVGHKVGITGSLTPVENLKTLSRFNYDAIDAGVEYTIMSALEALSISSKAHIPCRYLSAGQQRRVSLARLLLQDATLWVLDEPLTSLDTAGTEWVQQQIAKHVHSGGAVLLTTHADIQIKNTSIDSLELA